MVIYEKDIIWSRWGYVQSFGLKSGINSASILQFLFLSEIQIPSGLNMLYTNLLSGTLKYNTVMPQNQWV